MQKDNTQKTHLPSKQQGIWNHSYDEDNALDKEFVVVKVLVTGGSLWLKSFKNEDEAIKHCLSLGAIEIKHRIWNQFKNKWVL